MKTKVKPEQLKIAMRAWITGVSIVTGCHNGIYHGMTANSFNSIALTPPTVLVALNHHTRTQHVVNEAGVFAVSILDYRQLALAKRFAGQIDVDIPRFEGVDIFTMVTGAPLIEGAIAYLDCKVVQSFEVGGTVVFLGEVLESRVDPGKHQPLLYFNRGWRKLAE